LISVQCLKAFSGVGRARMARKPHRGGDQNSDEVDGAQADACTPVETKRLAAASIRSMTSSSLAGELMYVFPIERCDEALVQLGEDAMG